MVIAVALPVPSKKKSLQLAALSTVIMYAWAFGKLPSLKWTSTAPLGAEVAVVTETAGSVVDQLVPSVQLLFVAPVHQRSVWAKETIGDNTTSIIIIGKKLILNGIIGHDSNHLSQANDLL